MSRLIALSFALFGLAAFAADPATDALRDAVAVRKVRDSDLKGSGGSLTPYRDLAVDGGMLVGLEVGLGGSPPAEKIVAVRPIYRVGGRDRSGPPAGRFLSDEVRRTIRLIARDGYAVGGLQVSAGPRVHGLAVRFARVDGARLKTSDAYETDWVGAAKAEDRSWLNGDGRPIVGLFGRLQGDTVVGLGLTFADVPPPAEPLLSPPLPAAAAGPVQEIATAPTESSGIIVVILGAVVFAAVAVPIAVVGIVAFRRQHQHHGLLQLPRRTAIQTLAPAVPIPSRPPSIPGDVLLPLAATPTGRVLQDIVEMETDCFRH